MRKSLAIHGIHMESKGCVVYLMDILANTSCALWTSASSLILEVVVMGATEAVNGGVNGWDVVAVIPFGLGCR